MVSLAIISGACSTGCPRPIVAPPVGSIPQYPAGSPPGAARVSPLRRAPLSSDRLPRETIPGNPWKTTVAARKWSSIVIHHTATSRGSVDSIHEAHLRRKDRSGKHWKGIGYHFVIGNGNGMSDGEIESTFRWRTQMHGAHAGNLKHNQYGIGIALVGNFEKTPPTAAQLASIKRLVAVLKHEYSIEAKNIVGHSKIRATACPGRLFPLAEVSQAGSEYLYGSVEQQQIPVRLVRYNLRKPQ